MKLSEIILEKCNINSKINGLILDKESKHSKSEEAQIYRRHTIILIEEWFWKPFLWISIGNMATLYLHISKTTIL